MTRAGDQSLVSNATRNRLRELAVPFATALGRLGLTPNALTVIGFLGTCAAAVAAGLQEWLLAGVLVIAFGIFDMFDGALARATGKASQFGAFLDSTLDRTGENLVLAGIAFGTAQAGYPELAGLAAVAIAMASVVTYARAKAEALGIRGDVGVAPRPERLVILAIGLGLAGLLPWTATSANTVPAWTHGSIWLGVALGLIAALSAITVLQRILVIRSQLDQGQQSH
jgi:CDP-diacylglycerol--glycerol-3-phosphate 3-phosphatidyltransferase